MKGRFWKKSLAAVMALLIVSGGVPVKPFSHIFDMSAITAEAYLGEQVITYTIEREATGGRYIYYLIGSDGTSNILIDSKDASPTRVTIDMGDDVTFDVYAGGSIISCGGESKEKASIVGFNNYLNSSNLYITITSKTHAVRHIHVDGSGYKDFKAVKTSMEVEGKEQSLEVHWVKGSGGTRMGAPGKFVVTFTPLVKTYNINYNLNGGTNSASNPSTYDDDQNLTLASPTREGYTFDGWYTNSSFTGSPVKNIPIGSSGDKNLYAKWNINKYNITWKNYDGSVLKNDVFDYGSKPVYSGSTPIKPKDAQYTYKFSGWSPAITTVTGNQTYTAQYSSTLNTYTVTWKNGDKILKRDTSAPYGSTPVYDGETPTKEDDSKFYYTFTGWSPDVKTVSCNALYTAAYALTPKTYTVTYMVDGEVYGEPDTVAYGMTLIPRKIPVQKGYTFSGWSEMPKTMPDEDIVVTGTFSQDDYNIIIPDDMENGSVVSNKATAHYGDRVTLKITPESGYYIKCVNAGSAIVTRSAEGIYSFNMPAEDVTVSVELLKKIPAKAVTCTEDGYIEHYEGANGRIYIQIYGVFFETLLDSVIIDKTGHKYGEPVWEWSEDNNFACAVFTCTKCDDKQIVDAVVTSETVEPTYEADGKIVYTAKATFNGTEYTETKEVVIPKKVLVATVGDKKFDSLKAAIDEAYGDEVITVYADVDEPDVNPGHDQTWGCYYKNIELDLNGHTVTFGTFASNYGITIKNGTLNCMINNISNYFATLTLDNAVLNTPEAEDEYSQGISWMADRVEIKNGSTMVLNGNVYFNGWYSDPFDFNIDETSSVIMNNVLLSGSDEETVLAEIGEYLPTGYSFGKLEDEYSYRIFNADGEVVTDPVTLKQPVRTEVIIRAIDIDGDITSTKVYAETFKKTDYTVPASPYLDGYNFIGWTVNSRLLTTADEVQETIAALIAKNPKAPITVAVVYEKKVDTFKVTVINGSLSEGESGDNYQVGTELIATAAPAEEGLQFDHWENNGAVASYNEVYSFHVPSKELTLKAVYSSAETEIEKVGTAFIESVTTVNGNKIAFVSKFSIPEGARFLKAGIVANTEADLNGEELTTDTAKFTRYDDSKCYDYLTYKFTWTKSNVSEDDVWCVRPYLVYNDENGEHTVYGDLVKADLNGIITE
jgi:uncharacterized repeat protein (TIGR02543 family)